MKRVSEIGGTAAGERVVAHPWLVVAVAVGAQTLLWLDNSILNIALETLADPVRGLGATAGELAWAGSSYSLVFAAAMFAGGALGDRYGPRATMVVGLVVFSTASAFGAVSSTMPELVVARGFMGAGSALLMPATLSVVVRSTSEADRPKAIALWASASGIGVALGPVLGGALLARFWWGSVFLVNVPIVLVCLVGVAAFVPRLRLPERRPLDPAGLVLSVLGLGSLVYGIIEGGDHADWTAPGALVPLVLGVLLLAWFVRVQRSAEHPSFDVTLFTVRRFAGGSVALLVAFFGLTGQLFANAFYLQGIRGLTPFGAGVVMVAAAVGIVVGNLVSPRVTGYLTVRWTVVGGMLLAIATFAGYVFFDQRTPIAVLVAVLVAQGFGMGMISAPITTAMMAVLPPAVSGAGAAINSAMRQVGGALGTAVLGSVLTAAYHRAITPSLARLPEPVRDQAAESAQGARAVAATSGQPWLADAADSAFLHAMRTSSTWGTLLCLVGVVFVARSLRPER
ncbi:MFS transporter [Umezawaea tangerina]|uniref:EmrB/QacA subfamily drug resistance transporter n=1 Tax=Umezawaea tangerina TaxID=84725 RepID=A0A2T0SZL0_9PSEU|nr:MFS transporter [Umezawaea tangerina]PRY38839.1 EmrB/QacA subfamily drug resistance transporter [Umezawaea tangerina]